MGERGRGGKRRTVIVGERGGREQEGGKVREGEEGRGGQ